MSTLSETLYPDFTLTIENCELEPIHRPRAIQGHGHMLVVDRFTFSHLFAMSSGIPTLFRIDPQELWRRPIREWLPETMLNSLIEMEKETDWEAVDPVLFSSMGKDFCMIRHIHDNKLFIELEPSSGNNMKIPTFRAIRKVSEPLKRVEDLPSLFQKMAAVVKEITGYNRVMIYRFDPDYHGQVVGEAKEEHLETFLNLRYPATDIPAIARDLFLKNRTRLISDVNLDNHWLKFNPGVGENYPHLDLTYSQLRATSPIHIEYLQNMEVGASFTSAIVINGYLWGLIACHHYGPYFIPYELRKTIEVTTNSFIQRYLEIYQAERERDEKQIRERINAFTTSISKVHDLSINLSRTKEDLCSLLQASGYVAATLDTDLFIHGKVFGRELLLRLVNWLKENEKGGLYYTNDLESEVGSAISGHSLSGGLLSINIDIEEDIYLMWFREAEREVTDWGGDPSRPYEVSHRSDGPIRISPRKSFEKWKTVIENKSIHWEDHFIQGANILREALLKKEIDRQVEKAKILRQDYEELTYVASHDLQEPLRTIQNYLKLLEEDLAENNLEDIPFYFKRANLASERMNNLIVDMLHYSRVGAYNQIEWIDLNITINEVLKELDLLLSEKQGEIILGDLPKIKANRMEMGQLFRNLIQNALKYSRLEIKPQVLISAERGNLYWTIKVKDNGIGIAAEHFDKIFQLFRRLHGKEKFDGTGIGLAQCRKIVNSLGGKIWVTSQLGVGSTFHISIKNNIVNEHK